MDTTPLKDRLERKITAYGYADGKAPVVSIDGDEVIVTQLASSYGLQEPVRELVEDDRSARILDLLYTETGRFKDGTENPFTDPALKLFLEPDA